MMSLRPFESLDQLARRFVVSAGRVTVLTSPESFYAELKRKITESKRRIFLATLYIGTSQHELVKLLDQSLGRNSNLEVHILADGLRGTREAPDPCSASLVAPLVAKYPARIHVGLYQTPKLRGLTRLVVPRRFNEGWGLQHMKLYGFDDEIILSGANLSTDYFTNRQDRYVNIADKTVADYFFDVFSAVSKLSYTVVPADSKSTVAIEWDSDVPCPSEDLQGYHEAARRLLMPLLAPSPGAEQKAVPRLAQADAPRDQTAPTEPDLRENALIYPICQFTQLIGRSGSNELPAMLRIAQALAERTYDWTMTAGYFNVSEELKKSLLKSRGKGTVITAAQVANGFYKSRGVSKHVPALYSMLAARFTQAAERAGGHVQMREWQRGIVNEAGGWSYHAKGVWVGRQGERNPFLTVVGSSNFTRRAYQRDLEAGAVIITENPVLQAAFGDELRNLAVHTAPVAARDFGPPKLIYRLFVSVMGDRL